MSEWADLESELNSIGGATTTGPVSVINNNIKGPLQCIFGVFILWS